MKMHINLLLLPAILLSQACNDGKSTENNTAAASTTTAAEPPSADGLTGEWQRIESGYDANGNGVLDDNEKMHTKSLLDGYDYFKFMANGKCVFDKDIQFDGTYTVKPYKSHKEAIFIYPSGLPAGLSPEERDKNAYIYKIRSRQTDQLILSPAHTGTTLVIYKKK